MTAELNRSHSCLKHSKSSWWKSPVSLLKASRQQHVARHLHCINWVIWPSHGMRCGVCVWSVFGWAECVSGVPQWVKNWLKKTNRGRVGMFFSEQWLFGWRIIVWEKYQGFDVNHLAWKSQWSTRYLWHLWLLFNILFYMCVCVCVHVYSNMQMCSLMKPFWILTW